jgi:hypothetical protein
VPTLLRSEFRPLPPQREFIKSKAKIRGYGGAMGGGKSRALCEVVFNEMLDHPGLKAVLARAQHTSIIETTKKTMVEQVIPPDLITHRKQSGGEDYLQLWNGSVCHFIGLDDPYRWYSSEIGLLGFDESQEIEEEKAIRLTTRLRQSGMPNKAIFTFNPANPGHWLQKWFILGGEQTSFGFKKEAFVLPEASKSIGSLEFFFAKATDNIHLPAGYVEETLEGLPAHLRRRYLEGIWEFITGNSFFDIEAMTDYQRSVMEVKPVMTGRTKGDPEEDFEARKKGRRPKDPVGVKVGDGPLTIWRRPVKKSDDVPRDHRYVMAIDVSSGGGYDYSAIQVVCVETFEQVAEWQGKVTPVEVALEAYRLGRIYNNALATPEITGGWGFTIEQELKRLRYPNLYTRRILDRLSKKWTDRTGWDTTARTRAHMLDTLNRVLMEREFGLHSIRTLTEMGTFVYGKNNKPEAQDGCNDDLVVALAIAVTVALELPRELRRPKYEPHVPQFASTGY